LEALEANPPQDLLVADLGCGSGVLGLASLSLGADAVLAADTDSLAIRATAGNRSLNHCSEKRLEVALGSVETLQALLAGRRADLLLCNILAPVIEALSPGFESLIAPQGRGPSEWIVGGSSSEAQGGSCDPGLAGHSGVGARALGVVGDSTHMSLLP
jgi:ribosomal protein L11 methyltransferase